MEQEVNPKVEELKELGKFGLINFLGEKFSHYNSSTLSGLGENAAVIAHGNTDSVVSSKLFIENIHFDMTYVPLKHLGYKTITVAVADIVAMNALPKQVLVNIAISNRFSLEAVNELTDGMQLCCDRYGIDLAGLDMSSSQTGLIITVTAVGEVEDKSMVQRVGAKENELICVSGDLGAAYTGLILLEREKKSMHDKLMKEQQRAAKSRASGEKKIANKKWMKSVADLKTMKAEKSQGKNSKNLDGKKQKLAEELSEMRMPEIIVPKFHMPFKKVGEGTIVSVTDGEIGYSETVVASDINFSITSGEHIAIIGRNGSGKTTLLKAIMDNPSVFKKGDWHVPKFSEIGYLDQHYGNLDSEKSVVEIVSETNPTWTHAEIRKHLNDFLFRKNEEVNRAVKNLSGGEKARLSLARIAAKPPKLLILDEITNNIDLETKNHVAEILREYPAAMIVVSHDKAFLEKIKIDQYFEIATT